MNVDTLSLSVAEALFRTQRFQGQHPATVESGPPHGAVAISREVGALGEAVAREVGKRLRCPVYGREVVDKIAQELREPPEQLLRLDERPTFWIEDWLSGMPGTPPLVTMDTYVKFLYATMRGMAEVGRCVIVGRGAARILARERTLRVRTIADRADRIDRISHLRQVTAHEAAQWIDRTEEERDLFVRRNFGVDHADPHHYDLLLNTSRLSVVECADLIAEAFVHVEARLTQPAIS
jgi:Cytidylate kinase-like family